MTATLLRRVARLESAIPPPPPVPPATAWPGDDPPGWWDPLPPAGRRYLLALAEGLGEEDEDGDELSDLLDLLDAAGAAGVPFVAFQGTALWWSWLAAFHGGGTGDTFRQFWGCTALRLHEAYQDRTGAALVAVWRVRGTRALSPALLRLLAAS